MNASEPSQPGFLKFAPESANRQHDRVRQGTLNLRTPEPPKPPAAPHAESVDVCIVGSGPSGLAAAIELRRLGARRVLVVDREEEAGGIPRHADHIGFGMRDLHRVLTGPQYAGRYVRLAENVGVDLRRATTATDEEGCRGTLSLTSPGRSISTVSARAVLLATGCRERPRAARLVPGDRPLGVLTSTPARCSSSCRCTITPSAGARSLSAPSTSVSRPC